MSLFLLGAPAENAAKTACVNGHAFTPENTYVGRGKRECKTCHRERQVRYRARNSTPASPAVPGQIASAIRGNEASAELVARGVEDAP